VVGFWLLLCVILHWLTLYFYLELFTVLIKVDLSLPINFPQKTVEEISIHIL